MLGYRNFDLVLMASRRCNLACRYCYIGHEELGPVNAFGRKAIDRAINSLESGGHLNLQFFGGEPLLESRFILDHAEYARRRCQAKGIGMRMQTTTNGTLCDGEAWDVLTLADMDIAVSCDGLEESHDLNRRTHSGQGSWRTVRATLERLVQAGREVNVSCVVSPATLDRQPEGVQFLRDLGVRNVHLTLDLWTRWSPADLPRLAAAIRRCADLWVQRVGKFGIGWFDTLSARMSGLATDHCARCGYGAGQIAVSPTGGLYPCERLIGQDRPDEPERLPGHVADGEDFLMYSPPPRKMPEACLECQIRDICLTYCRCSNYARTGDTSRPDRLLCEMNKLYHQEIVRVLSLDSPSKEGSQDEQ